MFGSDILELVVGLVFIYWLLSLLCSGINEMISAAVSMRAKDLEKAIRNLLDDPKGIGLGKSIYDHGLIRALGKEGKKPSYIQSRAFALALMDMVAPSGSFSYAKKAEDIKEAIKKIQNDRLRQALLALADDAGSELSRLRENIERWFNDAMERVSGWYKRKVQIIITFVALAVCAALNADTFKIVKYLVNNEPMRAAIAEAAGEAIKQPISPDKETPGSEGEMEATPQSTPETPLQKIEYVQKELQKLPLPLGWYEAPKEFEDWVMKLLGIFFTAIAVSLGAPFWFDFLDKILKIRPAQSGKRPENLSQKG